MPTDVSYTDTLKVINAVYPEAEVYVYQSLSDNDTLEIYRDSIRLNSLRLEKIASRRLSINGRIVEVGKYQYDNMGTHAASHFFSNVFINDSLGLITLVAAGHHGTAVGEYSRDYAELHNQIREDSLFFELDYEVGRGRKF